MKAALIRYLPLLLLDFFPCPFKDKRKSHHFIGSKPFDFCNEKLFCFALQVGHRATPLLRSCNCDRTREAWLRTVQHRPGTQNPRANQPSRLNLVAPILNNLQFASHVSHAGHAVGYEKRQRNVLRIGEPVPEN